MAVGVWPVVPGQGPFYLVGRSWVTWWRRLGVASCGAVLGLGGRRPCCADRPADRWKWSFQVLQFIDKCDVLGGVLAAEGGGGGRRF